MEQFNFQQFSRKLQKNSYVKTVQKIDNNCVQITFICGLVLHIDILGDSIHKFYTFLPSGENANWYFGKMPHDNYIDLYHEIDRMSTPEKRKKQCKYPYFKGLF